MTDIHGVLIEITGYNLIQKYNIQGVPIKSCFSKNKMKRLR